MDNNRSKKPRNIQQRFVREGLDCLRHGRHGQHEQNVVVGWLGGSLGSRRGCLDSVSWSMGSTGWGMIGWDRMLSR